MKRHLKVLNDAIKILSEDPYRQYIEEIYLYGSCARGNEKYNSDVDLFLQCNQQLSGIVARKMRVEVMPDDIKLPDVELKFTKDDQWKRASDQFSQNIRKEGILVWKNK